MFVVLVVILVGGYLGGCLGMTHVLGYLALRLWVSYQERQD